MRAEAGREGLALLCLLPPPLRPGLLSRSTLPLLPPLLLLLVVPGRVLLGLSRFLLRWLGLGLRLLWLPLLPGDDALASLRFVRIGRWMVQ